ncbi:DDE-type integrase/transposase/recombinase [Roseobacter sp. MH60115]|uniref:DDE-type integrase/transposase/recombinase n=1 Tax=Roseobacter sp. MH60115 TaxID=2785324 RepID=UPI0018A2711C|nr:DDE-type integrase/transposase/recombinase [Roseobacter sp. MH60115]
MLDECTREALCVAVKLTMNSADMLDALYPLLLQSGKPEYVRSDNGSEFIAAALQDWLRKVGIKANSDLFRIAVGERLQRALQRSFALQNPQRRMVPYTKQAQIVTNTWLRQYDRVRPHQALNMRLQVAETLLKSGP